MDPGAFPSIRRRLYSDECVICQYPLNGPAQSIVSRLDISVGPNPVLLSTIDRDQIMVMHCDHIFHRMCSEKWFSTYKKRNCPICRKVDIPVAQTFNSRDWATSNAQYRRNSAEPGRSIVVPVPLGRNYAPVTTDSSISRNAVPATASGSSISRNAVTDTAPGSSISGYASTAAVANNFVTADSMVAPYMGHFHINNHEIVFGNYVPTAPAAETSVRTDQRATSGSTPSNELSPITDCPVRDFDGGPHSLNTPLSRTTTDTASEEARFRGPIRNSATHPPSSEPEIIDLTRSVSPPIDLAEVCHKRHCQEVLHRCTELSSEINALKEYLQELERILDRF